MCVAAPGKILSINGTTATVAYSGNRVPANLGVVKAQVRLGAGARRAGHPGAQRKPGSGNE